MTTWCIHGTPHHQGNADLFVLGHVLDPYCHVQAAWFVILVFPDHCDCLALLNAVQRQGEQGSRS